jgi:hypothetical protein
MADLQIDFSGLPDPIDLTGLPDDDKPKGKSHGPLLDALWNQGSNALGHLKDIGKSILDYPGRDARNSAEALRMLQEHPEEFKAKMAEAEGAFKEASKHPIANALSIASEVDPTGVAQTELSAGRSGIQNIKSGNYGGAAVDAGLVALPVLGALKGIRSAKVAPKVVPTEAPFEPVVPKLEKPGTPRPKIITDPARMLNAQTLEAELTKPEINPGRKLLPPAPIPERLALPPQGGTTPESAFPASNVYPRPEVNPRFYQGKLGTADARLEYPIDMADPRQLSSPYADEMQPGMLSSLPPEVAANRGLGKVPGKALLNPNIDPAINAEEAPVDPLTFQFPPDVGYGLGSGRPIKLTPPGERIPQPMGTSSVIPPRPGAEFAEPQLKPLVSLEHPEGGAIVNPPIQPKPLTEPAFNPRTIRPNEMEPFTKPVLESIIKPGYDPNRVDVINRTLSPEALGAIVDKNPLIASGEVMKPTLDEVNSTPEPPKKASDQVIPKPGQARPPGDISAAGANVQSPDLVLNRYDQTKAVVEPILKAQDTKLPWIRSTLQKIVPFTQGLDKQSRVTVGRILDLGPEKVPEATPELVQRAQGIREILDEVHGQYAEDAGPQGEGVGYLEHYFTHIARKPSVIQDGLKAVLKYHFGTDSPLHQMFVGGEELAKTGSDAKGKLFEKGMGDATSPYTKSRTGNLRDIEYDINKVMPAYIESAAREIFDVPAIESAQEALKNVPDGSRLKELATWYVKNYSSYDAEPGLHSAWSKVADAVARTTARSFIDWNIGLHTLHLGEIPANIWPELGTKYTKEGIKKVLTSPVENWKTTAEKGLIQGDIKPPQFKTPMERYATIAQFGNVIEHFVKGVGYHGAKAKFLAEGLPEAEADLKAIQLAKTMTLTVDPARQAKIFSPESNWLGGEGGHKLLSQFKGVPSKIVEQYTNIARDLNANPLKLATYKAAIKMLVENPKAIPGKLSPLTRAAVGAGAMGLVTETTGARLMHINPKGLAETTGAALTVIGKIWTDIVNMEPQKAAAETMAWLTPGGQALRKLFEEDK